MYEHLFKNYFKYFHNLRIILPMLKKFRNEIINFVSSLYIIYQAAVFHSLFS